MNIDPLLRLFNCFYAAIALIEPLFIDGKELLDEQSRKFASFYDVSSPQELELLQPHADEAENVVVNFKNEWQVACSLVTLLMQQSIFKIFRTHVSSLNYITQHSGHVNG